MPGSEFSTGCRGSNINFNLVENLLPGMLKIRLQRFGKKNSPSYRVVLVEHTAPIRGKFQEILGFYNPKSKEKQFKKDRIEYWISKGVQFSPTIHNLLVDEGILKKEKVKAWRPKKRSEAKPAEAPQQRDEGGRKEGEIKIEESKVEQSPEIAKVEEVKVAAPEGGEPSSESAGGELKPLDTNPV